MVRNVGQWDKQNKCENRQGAVVAVISSLLVLRKWSFESGTCSRRIRNWYRGKSWPFDLPPGAVPLLPSYSALRPQRIRGPPSLSSPSTIETLVKAHLLSWN